LTLGLVVHATVGWVAAYAEFAYGETTKLAPSTVDISVLTYEESEALRVVKDWVVGLSTLLSLARVPVHL